WLYDFVEETTISQIIAVLSPPTDGINTQIQSIGIINCEACFVGFLPAISKVPLIFEFNTAIKIAFVGVEVFQKTMESRQVSTYFRSSETCNHTPVWHFRTEDPSRKIRMIFAIRHTAA